MSNENENEQKSKQPLSLGRGKLELKRPLEQSSVRQSFSHGRSKTVTVEVKKKRTIGPDGSVQLTDAPLETAGATQAADTVAAPAQSSSRPTLGEPRPAGSTVTLPPRKNKMLGELTEEERTARVRALQAAAIRQEEEARQRAEDERRRREDDERRRQEEAARAAEDAARAAERAAEEARRRATEEEEAPKTAERDPLPVHHQLRETPSAKVAVSAAVAVARQTTQEEEEAARPKRPGVHAPIKRPPPPPPKRTGDARRQGKMTVTQALTSDDNMKVRSMAAMKRARERERQRQMQRTNDKVIREVVVPDSITVQELASRMAERGVDVIKALMRNGIMATINQVIDADTAELIVTEFGHTPKRASESDVEIGLRGNVDVDVDLQPRAPVVTVMGHVDHGKTSLLDALRNADVAAHEAGGITQHIGAYQVTLESGAQITFIDTPGHEAFTEMRARGANVTDIVILVVAADDGIMPQTVEAIRHAKAAGVPIIVAINKVDKPDANPQRVRTELLQHELVVEELGGDVLAVEVSAKTGQGLDKLQETIVLQAELLDLKANPDRKAEGAVIEAKLDRGRGSVATVLVQRGTLKVGDIFVAGGEWGRVRALINDRGEQVKEAGPSSPVEVLGLQGTPLAGDELTAVEDEARAREVADFRTRKKRDAGHKSAVRGTVEQMLSKIAAGEAKELPVVIKSDVQGSLEAIVASLTKIGTDEVQVRILHAGVGAISESDVTLANASGAWIIAFNVRANAQAREMAKRDGVDIRYYSIIYNVVDDVKAALTGMLSPSIREDFLGYAEIRQVFDVTKVGKVAGCMVTEGMVKRGNKVRLLRDNVVIHEGTLKTLRRFKEEVREVKQGFECGMAFENYSDIKVGDVIEAFEMIEEARTL